MVFIKGKLVVLFVELKIFFSVVNFLKSILVRYFEQKTFLGRQTS